MDIRELKKDITKGFLWHNIKYFLRLGCSMGTIYDIMGTRYGMGTASAKQICDIEIKKNMRKRVIYTMEKERKRRKTEERNQQIKFRFYDLHEKDRLRVDDVVKTLSKEFFLSEIKIVEIIRGAISNGELPISKSSIITHFHTPTRIDKKNKYLDKVVENLKKQYNNDQTAI